LEEEKTEINEVKAEEKKGSKLPLILIVLAVILVGTFLLGRTILKKAGELFAGRVLSGVTGGNVKVGEEGGKVTFENSEGEVSFEAGGTLPEGFPKDFPIYPDAKVASSFTANNEGKEGVSVVWETGDSVGDVSGFYKTNLVASGWKVTATFEQGGSMTTTFEKEGWGGFVGVTAAEGKTTISATIGAN